MLLIISKQIIIFDREDLLKIPPKEFKIFAAFTRKVEDHLDGYVQRADLKKDSR